jgi:uncharacterized protein YndB with AHSA1/START domain
MAAIEVDQFLPRPPGQVWRALTDPVLLARYCWPGTAGPVLLARWLMPNDVQPVPGHHFTLLGIPGGGWRGHLLGNLRALLDQVPGRGAS